MPVANVFHRLVAGAEVALAVSLVAGCGSAVAQPAATATSTPVASTAGASTPVGRPATATPKRSLLDAIERDGSEAALVLTHVPAGATCSATARLLAGSSPLPVSPPSRTAQAGQAVLTYSAAPPPGAVIRWDARCTLGGDRRDLTMVRPEPASSPVATGRSPSAPPGSRTP